MVSHYKPQPIQPRSRSTTAPVSKSPPVATPQSPTPTPTNLANTPLKPTHPDPEDKLTYALTTWRTILHFIHLPLQIAHLMSRNHMIGFTPPPRLAAIHTRKSYSLQRTRDLKRWMSVVWTMVILVDAGVWVRRFVNAVQAIVVVRRQAALAGRGGFVGRKSVGGGVSPTGNSGAAVYGVEDFVAGVVEKGGGAFVELFEAVKRKGGVGLRGGSGVGVGGSRGTLTPVRADSDAGHSMEYRMLMSEMSSLKGDMRIACLAFLAVIGDLPQAFGGTFVTSGALTESMEKLVGVTKDSLAVAAVVESEGGVFPSWFVGVCGLVGSLAAWRLRWKSDVTVDSL
ncbi:hypothetical protein HDU98_001156 [Podochytrium sp. JEL0797]|nr:hypothetical protein HDU98_001156 [Podochytrium sp. JEL0797]